MKKSEELARESSDSLDLDFPDWSGMDDSPARITPEAAFRLCQNYPRLISTAHSSGRAARPEKCIVEFVL